MVKKIMLLVVLLLVCVPVFAQTVDTAWVRTYDDPSGGDDWAHALAVDVSGNVYVTGESYCDTDYTPGNDYLTIKYYPNGDVAWITRRSFSLIPRDCGRAIVVDTSGNVYATGVMRYASSDKTFWMTVKYYPNGNIAWEDYYGSSQSYYDSAHGIALDDSGYVYVTGVSRLNWGDVYDYVTIKYKPNGDRAWVKTYGKFEEKDDGARAITLDDLGNIYVTGWSDQSDSYITDYDYATIRYYPNGEVDWIKTYDRDSNDWGRAVVSDAFGNVFVTGTSAGLGTTYDFATVKYDSSGTELWVKRYNGPGNSIDEACAIAVDASGSVYVTGWTWGGSETGDDYTTIRYYTNGDTAWVRRFNGPGNATDRSSDIATDDYCNVYITGHSWSGSSWGCATIKYDSSGNQVWVKRYEYGYAEDIAVDDSGNVYVVGFSYGSGTGKDYLVIKYIQTANEVKDETGDREIPSDFALSQNYPNPFNQSTKIEFTLAKSDFVNLKVYDILGRKIKILISEHLSPGYKSMLWDGKNDSGKDVASGIYFYQLIVGNFSETKKLVLLK